MKLYNFEEFVNEMKSNEEHSLLLEAFNSSILQRLTSAKKGNIGKKFFDALSKMGIAASEITNLDITTVEPRDAENLTKSDPNLILIYYSEREKENPFSKDYWYKKIEGNTVLAVVKGKLYMGLNYDRYASKKSEKAEYSLIAAGSGTLGMDDKSNSKYGSGLNTLKKMAEVSDVVYVIDSSKMPASHELRNERVESRKGAAAFKDDKDFKRENQARYAAILADKASKDDIDGLVQDAINTLTDQIKSAVENKSKSQYGEYLIGQSPKGREVRLSDATRHIERIMEDYRHYTDYKNNAERSESRHGEADSFYSREYKKYAKQIKNSCSKIESLNYAW